MIVHIELLENILEISFNEVYWPRFYSVFAIHIFCSQDFGLTGLPLTPSVHLSSEVEIDSNEEATTLSKSLFSCENGRLLLLRNRTFKSNKDEIKMPYDLNTIRDS